MLGEPLFLSDDMLTHKKAVTLQATSSKLFCGDSFYFFFFFISLFFISSRYFLFIIKFCGLSAHQIMFKYLICIIILTCLLTQS